jgi:hypothetical protein
MNRGKYDIDRVAGQKCIAGFSPNCWIGDSHSAHRPVSASRPRMAGKTGIERRNKVSAAHPLKLKWRLISI